ncbi:MAG: hypothetical protein ABIH59_01880 [archaeon]
MKRGIYLVSLILTVLIISFATAGIFDDLFKSTGKAPSATKDVRVTVTGSAPTIYFVEGINPVNPIEGNPITIVFEVRVSDPNGVGDIDDSSVTADFELIGEPTRSGTCIHDQDLDAASANYSCSVNLMYYDAAGTWTVKINAQDISANPAPENTDEQFDYYSLNGLEIVSPVGSLAWDPLTAGTLDQLSNNDPTVINNTGNYDGTIRITGYDLEGENIGGEFITINQFSVASTTGGVPSAECDVGVTAVALGPLDGNTVDTLISSARGPPATVANVYYCLDVPIVSAQPYSTTESGNSWTLFYL